MGIKDQITEYRPEIGIITHQGNDEGHVQNINPKARQGDPILRLQP